MAFGWGTFFGTLMEKLPIQGRKERWKNELDDLKQERANLLAAKVTVKAAERIPKIDMRIEVLQTYLKNAATD
jgi:hypothetical protein